jgi:diguanylate cyclase (GGDEF)-like protein
MLAEAAAYLGYTTMNPDSSGVVRGINLSIYDNSTTEQLSFIKALWKVGNDGEKENTPLSQRNKLLSDKKLENNFSEYIRIPFSGKVGLYPSLSYVDVLRSETLRRALYDKYILIGLNADGLGSQFITSLSQQGELMSGTEFNAHALSALLKNEPILNIKPFWNIALTVLLVVIPIFLYSIVRPSRTIPLSISFMLLTLLLSFILLKAYHIWFGASAVLVFIALGCLLWGIRRSRFISRLLFNERAQARATLLAIGDAVITTDAQGKIEFMNSAAEKMSGYSSSRARGQVFPHIFIFKDVGECECGCGHGDRLLVNSDNPLFKKATVSNSQLQCLTNQAKERYAVQLAVNPIFDGAGSVSGIVYAISDLTEVFEMSQQMAHLATHDVLTELPNRLLLHDRLTQAINLAGRSKKHIATLFIDLDGFKKINDGLGHSAGDLLLVQVAKRLQLSIRKMDTAARWGGDEFVIMLEGLDHEEFVVEIAEKILQTMSEPMDVYGQEVFITPSIGISLYPKDGTTADGLLAKADAAMYSVKENGRNGFHFYAKELNKTAKARLEMEKDLRIALLNSEFELYYQPQVNLETRQIVGAEALIRWKHPKKGTILPSEFISLAEDINLITPIGEWVLEAACKQLQAWRNQNMPEIHLAVNISPRHFMQGDLLKKVKSLVKKYGIKPNCLGIEVTENLMLKDIDQVIETLNGLKRLGISIALDDFGSGFSSLNYLKQLPIDTLKIDQSFIKNLFTNKDDVSIVQAVVILGHKMGMTIIAEGIETHEQYLFLKENNCNVGQGFYFDKPIPAFHLASHGRFWDLAVKEGDAQHEAAH